jgi:tetratricopeptide (TPR) repeat protein
MVDQYLYNEGRLPQMSLSSIELPKPKDWQDFERKTRVLFKHVLNDPSIQLHGRSGQRQNGVDIFGCRDGNPQFPVGIQCKQTFSESVGEKELRSEVSKARNFQPHLTEFILASTARRDVHIQKIARLITEELATSNHPLRVSVWGWEDIEENAAEHEAAFKTFYPSLPVSSEQGLEKLTLKVEESHQLLEKIHANAMPSTASGTSAITNESIENTPRHGEITMLQHFVFDGHVKIALPKLLKIKREEWVEATSTEKYRLLIAIANAELRLGNENEAGNLILQAYGESPDHEKAQENRATGYLLVGDFDESARLARKMLVDDPENAVAAGTLIQALVGDTSIEEPLDEVPSSLHDHEEVLVAYIHFLRSRELDQWIEVTKKAFKKFPNSNAVKRYWAEGVLVQILEKDRDAMSGGILESVHLADIKKAVKIIDAQADEALKNGYAISAAFSLNAALGHRFLSNFSKAKEILDRSLKQNSDNEEIRVQRAVLAIADDDPKGALSFLPEHPASPEGIGLLAKTLAELDRWDDSIDLIAKTDASTLPQHVQNEFVAIRARCYMRQGKKDLALELIKKKILQKPDNFKLRVLLIRAYRVFGNEEMAVKALEETLERVNDETRLLDRLEFSFEASRLGRNDAVIKILTDRVSLEEDNEGLYLLIAAVINSGSIVTAKTILCQVSEEIQEKDWYLRAIAILAINSGDPNAEDKIAKYLRSCPNDVEMILARISIWQTNGRESEIQLFLQNLLFEDLQGLPEQLIQLGAIAIHYRTEALTALNYCYSILMNNWDDSEVHLAYQRLLLMDDENLKSIIPADSIAEVKTVVSIVSEGSEQRFRIEQEHFSAFEEERLGPETDMAKLLIGKHPGDKIIPKPTAKPIEILWVKPVYIDALHCSIERFNERFLGSDGLKRYSFDPNSEDPLEEIREITKKRAEAEEIILREYQTNSMPLAFVSALLGRNPMEVWAGLQAINIPFIVCYGLLPERENAFRAIEMNEKKGCVLDAVTTMIVYNLGIEKAVAQVCGPINLPASVRDLFSVREMQAKQDIGKKQKYIVWHEGKLIIEELTKETMQIMAGNRLKELNWVREQTNIVGAMPKRDFSADELNTINLLGRGICDPAISASGNELLLLSEDLGFRIWSQQTFNASNSWLQPVLSIAMAKGYLAEEEYFEAINRMVLMGHRYVYLDPGCLIYQARNDKFDLSADMILLLKAVGGPLADLHTNTDVMSAFIDVLWKECPDELRAKRITGEGFSAMTVGRPEEKWQILDLIIRKTSRAEQVIPYAKAWLEGHSLGNNRFWRTPND